MAKNVVKLVEKIFSGFREEEMDFKPMSGKYRAT